MKALYTLVFIAFYLGNTLFSQDEKVAKDSIQHSQQEWNDIVDYVNAEVTAMAMVEYRGKQNSLSKKEITGLNEFSLLKIENSTEKPVSFKKLSDIIKPGWNNTFQNISTPIDSLKRNKRLLDSLFINVESILLQRKSTVFKTPKYKDLKLLIDKNSVKKNYLNAPELIESKAIVESTVPKTGVIKKRPFWDLWMIPSLLFLISTVVFFLMWRKANTKHNKLIKQVSRESKLSNDRISILSQELNGLKRKNSIIKSKPIQKPYGNTYSKPLQERSIAVDEPKSPEVDLTPIEIPKAPKIIYAGKPTIDNKFSTVSNSPMSGETIYKLHIHDDGINADFEINLVDNFITREVTNAPDEYLYRVCNQENSNKDFSREIITTKKGHAVLIDGNWIVKEGNKATIKFQ